MVTAVLIKIFTFDKILVDSKDRVWFHSSDESIYLVNYDFQNGKINTVLRSTLKLPYISDIIEIDNTIMLSSEDGLYECNVDGDELLLNKLLGCPIASAIVISSSQNIVLKSGKSSIMFIRQAYLQGKYPVGKLRYTKNGI